MTLQLIAGSKAVPVVETVRLQRAALGIAETLERLSQAHEGETLKTGLSAVEVALKPWNSTLRIQQRNEKKHRAGQ